MGKSKKYKCKQSELKFLKVMKRLKPIERNEIIEHLNEDAINTLSRCVNDVLCGTLKISKKQSNNLKKRLDANKHNLRIISKGENKIQRRKKALSQEGGSLGFILSAAIPLLTNLISSLAQ